MRIHARSIVACLVLTQAAFAQRFNIDIGTGNAVPSPTFGAAAAQPGVWNQVGALAVGGSAALVDLSGAATPVQLKLTAGAAPTLFHFDNGATTGDDELLMDDAVRSSSVGGSSYAISGLPAGAYAVYTYAWAPDNAAFVSAVSVNGIDGNVGGSWTGTYSQSLTHVRFIFSIPAGADIMITMSPFASFATLNGIQIRGMVTPSTPFCSGDVVGTTCLGCGNNGAPGHGCGNSAFPGGGHLETIGEASISNDSLTLLTTDAPSSTCIFFQSSGIAPSPLPYGDGMLCAAVGITRLGVAFGSFGAEFPGFIPGPIHISGGPLNPGDIRHYQCWIRDAVIFCAPGTFNMTNGVTLTWAP